MSQADALRQSHQLAGTVRASTSEGRVNVMHLTDTLDAGGAERVAVNLANLLPQERYRACLCTTRRDGPLAELVLPDVERLRLARRHRFDLKATQRLIDYIRSRKIQILHAHSTTLFLAGLAASFPPHPAVIWHDHYGNYAVQERHAWLYRLAMNRARGVISVNRPLADWAQQRLRVPAENVWYIPNFACAESAARERPVLPGVKGSRIVCVANLRPQKDHLTLVRALATVARQFPSVHLLLVGETSDAANVARIKTEIERTGLARHITLLGQRMDVFEILRQCDIGVLSSASEGLPLALIEYGIARLPVVATRVGQCAEVLHQGQAGILVPPAAPDKLAAGLLSILNSPSLGQALGERLSLRVEESYSPQHVLKQIERVYKAVLQTRVKT